MSLFQAARNRATVLPSTNVKNPLQWFKDWTGGGQSAAGISVNEENMVSLSSVFNAVTLLSETVAQQPLAPFLEYQEGDLTKRRKYREHASYRLVAYEALPGFMTAFTWRKLMMNFACRWQNAYSVIERDGNMRPIGLIPVHPTRVTPKITTDKEFRYVIDHGNFEVSAMNMIHIIGFTDDGLQGKSLATMAKDSLGHALATEKYGGSYFGKGINVSGFIQTQKPLKDEDAVDRLKTSFVKKYGGQNGQFGVGVLEDGADWIENETNPEEAQLNETRKVNVEEVARWLNVPVPLLKQIDSLTYNNAEQVDIQFTKYTIAPWNVNFEQEYRRKLLTEREKRAGNVYFKHNMNGLLRGDTDSRAKFYESLSKTGAFSPNMILEREDENPYEGGDVHVVNPGAQTVENINEDNDGDDL